MKKQLTTIALFLAAFLMVGESLLAQSSRDLQYYRSPDKTGINVFETSKDTDVEFDGLHIRIGGANTLQFQGLTNDTGPELSSNFNLANSNLDIDVQLHRGVRMHLRTYLSSRNHTEAWVKGGYMQVDRLDFIQEDFLAGIMDKVTIKIGHMTNNYGDAHFRRTDNAQAIYNPFVGNYIMDAFTTEVGGEVYFQHNGFLAMVGVTNGKLNQTTLKQNMTTKPSYLGKIGFDKQINPDFRFRLTGSLYTTSETASVTLYSGDRAGSRYFNVTGGGNFSGRFSPDFSVSGFAPGGPIGGKLTSFMINPFVKYQGLEFFGLFENASGRRLTEASTRSTQQYGAELLYRIGSNEQLYVGGRFNLVDSELANGDDVEITRFNIGGGWFLTKNVLAKFEYVNQDYSGFTGTFDGAGFDGIMLEAVISF
ncbi:MAG: hypothetical protein ACNA78_05115 [Balneolaceae bacterium]